MHKPIWNPRACPGSIKLFRGLSLLFLFAGAGNALAQAERVVPQILSQPESAQRVTVVEVAPRFVTTIRLPQAVNSVVVGNPAEFQVEHSEREPKLVFVKALSTRSGETNLLISTSDGHELSLLLINRGENPSAERRVAFVVRYDAATGFLVGPAAFPSTLIGETVSLGGDGFDPPKTSPVAGNSSPGARSLPPVSVVSSQTQSTLAGSPEAIALDELLEEQTRTTLPPTYGEHINEESKHVDRVRAGVSRVIDQGQQVIALFSVVNPSKHAILLMPPQVQLGGKLNSGKLLRHTHWSTAEQLVVLDFRLNKRRLGPGERADGVVMFERPPYKQSNETLLLQVAEAGAVDRPALAPIGFGISTSREQANGKGN